MCVIFPCIDENNFEYFLLAPTYIYILGEKRMYECFFLLTSLVLSLLALISRDADFTKKVVNESFWHDTADIVMI